MLQVPHTDATCVVLPTLMGVFSVAVFVLFYFCHIWGGQCEVAFFLYTYARTDSFLDAFLKVSKRSKIDRSTLSRSKGAGVASTRSDPNNLGGDWHSLNHFNFGFSSVNAQEPILVELLSLIGAPSPTLVTTLQCQFDRSHAG